MATIASDDPTPFFDVSTADHGQTRTLTPSGEIDLASGPELRRSIRAAVTARPEILVLDLSQTTFIDSTGVHIVLDTDAWCQEAGVRLVILPAPDGVHDVFELSGIADRLPIIGACRHLPPGSAP